MLHCHLSAALPPGGHEDLSWRVGPGPWAGLQSSEGSAGPAGWPSSLTADGRLWNRPQTVRWLQEACLLQILEHREPMDLIRGVPGAVPQEWVGR